jgi:NitT/TauT family transport system substrate-binding protein
MTPTARKVAVAISRSIMQRFFEIIATLMLAAIGFSATPAAAQTKITFLYNASASFAAIFVAQDQGFLARRGLEVEFSLAQSGAVMPPALVAGSVQIAAPTSAVLVQASEQGLDLVVIANTSVYPSPPHSSGVVARTESGIKGPRDLVGRKVGLPSLGGIFEVLMRKWVQANGVDDHAVQWVEVQIRQMGDALKSGLVDVVVPVEPFYSRVINSKAGYDIGDFESVVPAGTMPVVYATTRDWARANAGAVKAFRAALDEAILFIDDPEHAEAVRASIAKYTKLPPEAAATLAIPSNLATKAKPEGLSFWIAVMREQGLIHGNPDPASLIAP